MVLDGLGWDQLTERRALAPTLAAMEGGPIDAVAPTTTATSLTSITTGLTPGEHGVVGYRMAMHGDVLNVLRWNTQAGDARRRLVPTEVQPRRPFLGSSVPVVAKASSSALATTGTNSHEPPRGHEPAAGRLPPGCSSATRRRLAVHGHAVPDHAVSPGVRPVVMLVSDVRGGRRGDRVDPALPPSPPAWAPAPQTLGRRSCHRRQHHLAGAAGRRREPPGGKRRARAHAEPPQVGEAPPMRMGDRGTGSVHHLAPPPATWSSAARSARLR